LPSGPEGFKDRFALRRKEQLFLYGVFCCLYGAAGLWLTVFAIRLFLGTAPP